jgi:hypothetical protein
MHEGERGSLWRIEGTVYEDASAGFQSPKGSYRAALSALASPFWMQQMTSVRVPP